MSDSLMHYASKYYDPVKAHEYYMRTRELKGKRSASTLNDEGKKIWSYTKQRITEEKKAETDRQKEEHAKQIEQLRQRAAQSRERITEKLTRLNGAITRAAATTRKRINSQYKVPKNAPEEVRERLLGMKNRRLSELENAASSDKARNSSDIKAVRERVSTELKSAISAAREAYKKAKTSVDTSYEEIFQREFDRIASEYSKESKKSKTASAAVSSSSKKEKKPDMRELISY